MQIRTLALAALFITSTAYAGFSDEISVAGGNYHIKRGSPVSKVVQYLGEPLVKTSQLVCSQTNEYGSCLAYSTVETWQYEIQFYDWYIRHTGGTVINVKSVKQ